MWGTFVHETDQNDQIAVLPVCFLSFPWIMFMIAVCVTVAISMNKVRRVLSMLLFVQGNLAEQEGFDLVQLCGTFSANPFIMAFAQVKVCSAVCPL